MENHIPWPPRGTRSKVWNLDRASIRYSAALTTDNDALPRVEDDMKSEMRGTISDRKREPLNTP